MIKKQSDLKTGILKYTIIATIFGILTFSAISVLTNFLISNGFNESAINKTHMLFITMLIISCAILHIMIHSYKLKISKLKEHATTDKLTELYNRNYLDIFLENQIEAANKTHQPLSIIMVDLDHFKEINDANGHAAGDHVLTIFAQVVLKCIRKTDIIARYGGDEFIVVLPNTDTETARLVAERLRSDVENAHMPSINGINISPISCSVGISTYPVHCDSKHNLIQTSDLALYEAKRTGRNRAIVYSAVQ